MMEFRYPDISIVGIRRGKVEYLSIDVEPNEYGDYKTEEEEPYEEAFRIVQEEARK